MDFDRVLAVDRIPSRYWQLIDGNPIVDDTTDARQAIAMRILDALKKWARAVPRRGEALAYMNAVLDERNIFQPDISYLREDRVPVEDINHIDGPPDLAVEIRSLATWRYNVGPKMRAYERCGLRELWLVDSPVVSVLVYRRSDPTVAAFDLALELISGESLTSPLLPGFRLAIDNIFAPLRPPD
jgi:Uma2 family endonuclease